MWVLSEALKWSMLSISRIDDGREFHRRGAMEENARSPYPLRWVMCIWRARPDERSLVRRWRRSITDDTYAVVWPSIALNMSSRTLNSILLLTGSQCSSARTGEMWSCFLSPVSKRAAAAFCTAWSLFKVAEGRPARRLLQKSSLDERSEWIRLSVAILVSNGLMVAMLRSWK